MAISNASLAASLTRIEREVVALRAEVARLSAPVAAVVASPAAPVASAPEAVAPVARPFFAASGATLKALAAAGDVAAQAEIDLRAAKRATK